MYTNGRSADPEITNMFNKKRKRNLLRTQTMRAFKSQVQLLKGSTRGPSSMEEQSPIDTSLME